MRKGIFGLIFLLTLYGLFLWGCQANSAAIPAGEPDPAVWGEVYTDQYATYLKNSQMSSTLYRGSEPVDYLEMFPQLKIIYEGMGFSQEYFRSRGHVYALEDVKHIARAKPGGTCMSCKSSNVPGLLEKYGAEFYSMPFEDIALESDYPVACLDCHNPSNMERRISRPFLTQALDKTANPPAKTSAQDLVCAQCHVEYYFDQETLEVVLPWEKGLKLHQVEEYFDEMDYADWVHPRAGTPLIKIQHPEYQFYLGSVHDSIGLTCVGCHMPTVKGESGQEIPSHWWTSPLNHMEESCSSCHQDLPGIRARCEGIQEETTDSMEAVMDKLVDIIEGLAVLAEQGESQELEKIRGLHRKAHIRFDWVFVENSWGFHHSKEARELLDEAHEYADQALELLIN